MGLVLYVFFILCVYILLQSAPLFKRKPHKRGRLPPGSLGWPYIGETLKLFSQDPNRFFSAQQKRWGDVFKTHVLGCPCVVMASPEAARFVLVTESGLFKPTYPRGKERLIGPWALFFHQGAYHSQVRKLVQASLSLDIIRTLVPQIESIAVSALDSCSLRPRLVNTFHEMKKFTFDVAVLLIFGELDIGQREKLKSNYYTIDRGYNSFPINIPGTAYRQSVLARRELSKILKEMIWERKKTRSLQHKDLLNSLLNFSSKEGRLALTDDQIADNIIGVLFAAQDTTASLLTWILKYIHDHPKLKDAIKAEQMAVRETNGSQYLTWAQTRNMAITSQAISESLRLASIISYTYREAVEDVEYKGYLIPKGWKVLPSFRNIHHNPNFFENPLKFDPSRFEAGAVLKPSTFIPFGNGIHACPGNEVAKLQILILIHHLVINYRWEVVGSTNEVQYDPFPIPWKGLPARFWKECKQSDF